MFHLKKKKKLDCFLYQDKATSVGGSFPSKGKLDLPSNSGGAGSSLEEGGND